MKSSAMAQTANPAVPKKPQISPAPIRFKQKARTQASGFTLLEIMIALAVLVLLASVSFRTIQVILVADATAHELERQGLGVQATFVSHQLEEVYSPAHLSIEERPQDSTGDWQLFEISSKAHQRRAIEIAFRVKSP